MSDLLEIVRKKDGVLNPIQREEIQAVAQSSTNMQIGPSHLKSAVLNLTVAGNDGKVLVLTLLSGKLLTNNTGNPALSVTLEIAQKLNARVRDGDFETYDSLTASFTTRLNVLFIYLRKEQSCALHYHWQNRMPNSFQRIEDQSNY